MKLPLKCFARRWQMIKKEQKQTNSTDERSFKLTDISVEKRRKHHLQLERIHLCNCSTLPMKFELSFIEMWTWKVLHCCSCNRKDIFTNSMMSWGICWRKWQPKISSDVKVEPLLEGLTGEQLPANTKNETRIDLSIRGFWQRVERASFDVTIFKPFSPSNHNQKLRNVFKSNEAEKKRKDARCVLEIEHGTFSPLMVDGNCQKLGWISQGKKNPQT